MNNAINKNDIRDVESVLTDKLKFDIDKKFVSQSSEYMHESILNAEDSSTGEELLKCVYKDIELAARVCYKSEDKITDNSYIEFVNRLKKMGHNAMLEFGTIYLIIPAIVDDINNQLESVDDSIALHALLNNKFTHYCVNKDVDGTILSYSITTNYRVVIENSISDNFVTKYICKPNQTHERRRTVRIITNRAVSHEIVRHRALSFAQQSQRMSKPIKDENGEIIDSGQAYVVDFDLVDNDILKIVIEVNSSILDSSYVALLKDGVKQEDARLILPNCTKTELVVCGFDSQWDDFISKRTVAGVYPPMRKLANMISDQLSQNR